MGQVSVTPTAALNPLGNKADFQLSPFYRKGVHTSQSASKWERLQSKELRIIENLLHTRGLPHITSARSVRLPLFHRKLQLAQGKK